MADEVAQHVFVKRTRRGKIRRVVREHYLRDDLLSGSPHIDPSHTDPRLSADAPRYIVPDANVVLHQLDVLEHAAMQDVVLLQTVLAEVRHRRVALYNRARALAADSNRRVVVFCNEHHRETYVSRALGESPNDHNDRAIRTAVEWYARQLRGVCEVLLLTNDVDNLRKARAAGLAAQTVHEYVHGTLGASHPELADRLAAADVHADGGGGGGGGASDEPRSKRARAGGAGGGGAGGALFEEHLPMPELRRGLAAKRLHQGRLRVNRHNPREGYVAIGGERGAEGSDVLISGRELLNRAVNGDTVVVEVLPREQWTSSRALAVRADADAAGADDDAAQVAEGGANARVFASEAGAPWDEEEEGGAAHGGGAAGGAVPAAAGARPCARVVGIVKRAWRACVGVLDFSTQRGSNFLFEPVDVVLPRASLSTRQPDVLQNMLIVAVYDGWERHQRYPTAHYVRTIGPVGTKQAESAAILFEHDVPVRPFSAQVQACLPRKGWRIPEDEVARRLDLRESCAVCSVDPPGCVDIDDALHVRPLPNGRVEVGVHIADVGHFIKANTPIDEEAAARATTVYLVEQRIDMVPKRLGEDLCSLHAGVDRLAFSVLWEMDPSTAEVLSTRFAKCVIRSRAAFSYADAQALIDDGSKQDALATGLRTLNGLAKLLTKRRRERGALVLASPEVRFKLDSESSDPSDVGVYEHKETNAMVEEFMLLANTSVARQITDHYPQFAVLRRHPPPRPGAFDPIQRALHTRGLALRVSTSRELAASLDEALDPADPYFNKLVRILATRSMQQAEYLRAGSMPPTEYWHYGLAAEIYTHFTSPIRRYADQLVHRLLAATLGLETLDPELLQPERLEALVENMNRRHVSAQHAGRASVGVHTLFFFRERSVVEAGYVIKVRQNGVVVLVPRYGIEAIVRLGGGTTASQYVYSEEACTLRTPGGTLRVFQKVEVSIAVDMSKPHRPRLAVALTRPKIV